MTFRPAPLRAAAALAVVFVAARVIYRILFNGAGAVGPVLLDLPSVRLPAPYAHVVFLGPVTAPGLWEAILSALPIAGMILAFGLLNAWVDIARGFVRMARGGPFQGIARTLVVAWAALPALADAVGSVRLAFRLRGERLGARALVPILERTLEHAGRVAAALELRGFGSRTARRPGSAEAPIELLDAEFRIGDTRLRVDNFVPASGSITVITGPTGSGKSTVLRGIAGLLSHVDGGKLTGTVRVAGVDRATTPPRDTAAMVGVVLQNPRAAFASTRVRDEISLALELRGMPAGIAKAHTMEIAERIGVSGLLDRNLSTLSAGEATLVAIAAAVVQQPDILLVDEPLADLDSTARAHVIAVLDHLAHESGVCVIVAEHRAEPLAPVADSWWGIDDDGLVPGAAPAPLRSDDVCSDLFAAGSRCTDVGLGSADVGSGSCEAPAEQPPQHEPVLTATQLAVYRDGKPLVRDVSLTLHSGEVVALVGPNGAGKSSLLVALALGEGTSGTVDIGRVALVPDASDDLFTRDTVAGELRAADRRYARARARRQTDAQGSGSIGPMPHSAESRLVRLRGSVSIPTGNEHPRDLSAGERRILAIALQTMADPQVLLIDEPTRGLDPEARAAVSMTLRRAADDGAAVLIATHDLDFARGLGARIVQMKDGVAPAVVVRPALRVDSKVWGANQAPQVATPLVVRPALRVDSEVWGANQAPQVATPLVVGPALRGIDGAKGVNQAPQVATPLVVGPALRVNSKSWGVKRALQRRLPRVLELPILAAANLLALGAFCWPLLAAALPQDAAAAVPYAALAIAPLAVVAVVVSMDGSVRSAHTVALLGVLAAVGSAVRVASTGVGGVEAVFILLILAGRAFGPRFGMLLGALTIAVSSLLWSGIGPWSPFQIFACAWVGAGAGLLPRRVRGRAELWMLCGYGVAASYVFGLLTNLWFWPFAVGAGTGISYVPGAPLATNLSSFLLYSLVTSTAGWDTLRAITTIIGIAVVGRSILAAFRRAKPLSISGGDSGSSPGAKTARTRDTPAKGQRQLTP